jgi:hypothetical protein
LGKLRTTLLIVTSSFSGGCEEELEAFGRGKMFLIQGDERDLMDAGAGAKVEAERGFSASCLVWTLYKDPAFSWMATVVFAKAQTRGRILKQKDI